MDLRGISVSDELSQGTILEHLTDLAYIRRSIEYKRIGVLADLSYVGIGAQTVRSAEGALLRGRVPVAADAGARAAYRQGIYDLALRYRFGACEEAIGKSGDVTVIPYLGIHFLDVETEAAPDASASAGRGMRRRERQRSIWRSLGAPVAQPLIGLQGQVFLSPRLRVHLARDMGGSSPRPLH